MPTDLFNDPVLRVIKFAFRMVSGYSLDNTEAAIYSAAFALYGPSNYMSIASEAAYYNATTGGTWVDVLLEAHKRRMQAGTLGSMDTIARWEAPEV